eukprot:8944626-Pyramimonas_sp.AAC.1
MAHENPGAVDYAAIGGLGEQIRELRESIELPLMNPELFLRVGIKPPKGVLLYGPPGTGKTLLARAIASNIDANFLKVRPSQFLNICIITRSNQLPSATSAAVLRPVVASAIVDKYIGESARVIREMFGYARDHQPCIIFMDESFRLLVSATLYSATGRKCPTKSPAFQLSGARMNLEAESRKSHPAKIVCKQDFLVNGTGERFVGQLDGFDVLGKVKMIMATNRPDVLDPALLRPGRLDRKIEIPLPNEHARQEILKIHASGITKHGDIDYEAIVKLAENFNGADMRNVCTEAGMFAIRDERDYVVQEDFMKAVRKLNDAKKLESSASYDSSFGKE